MFEAWLHLMKPSEAGELVRVLIFGQEARPPASGLLWAAVQLRTVLAVIGTCAGGPL